MEFAVSNEEYAQVVAAAQRVGLANGAYAAKATLSAARGATQPAGFRSTCSRRYRSSSTPLGRFGGLGLTSISPWPSCTLPERTPETSFHMRKKLSDVPGIWIGSRNEFGGIFRERATAVRDRNAIGRGRSVAGTRAERAAA